MYDHRKVITRRVTTNVPPSPTVHQVDGDKDGDEDSEVRLTGGGNVLVEGVR